jgi:hypothetical protein
MGKKEEIKGDNGTGVLMEKHHHKERRKKKKGTETKKWMW